jgi:hypothetical protein
VIVDAGFLDEWKNRGHYYGECMSHASSDLMYVHIPKNASSWTKPNLLDQGWEFFNYHKDNLRKHAIVALRDPVDRWISGIAEYLYLYHKDFDVDNTEVIELIFDRIVFDDHTEKQVKFIHGLNTDDCTFLRCDDQYAVNFSALLATEYGANNYANYQRQHVSADSPDRKRFKEIFTALISDSKYHQKVQDYFEEDYKLMNSVEFYGTR